ncbi:MAG: phage holin family protein [Candidatus Melainabacteria bacterium]
MSTLLLQWLLMALVMIGMSHLMSGVEMENMITLVGVALTLAMGNLVILPVLRRLHLPRTITTLALFAWVGNVLMLLAMPSFFRGFGIGSMLNIILAGVILAFTTTMVSIRRH